MEAGRTHQKANMWTVGPISMDASFVYKLFLLLAFVVILGFMRRHWDAHKIRLALLKVHESNRGEKPGMGSLQKAAVTQPEEFLVAIKDFDIHATEPERYRPFKPIYHMSMGLRRCDPNELILLDKDYVARIQLRRKIFSSYENHVIGGSKEFLPVVHEFYEYMMGKHLPTRFPGYFTIDKHANAFKNKILDTTLPLTPPLDDEDGTEALKLLGQTIEEDLLFMTKSESGEYVLRCFLAGFPAGFDTSKKCGMTLREIHGPVPLYKEKLAFSMDKYFAKLEVGKWVQRLNWSITTTSDLFTPSGYHVYDDDGIVTAISELDPNEVFMRVERQVLLRLPETKALVFVVKTYLTPLADVKKEGLGDDLATAIDGLPDIVAQYKGRGRWGEAAKAVLRS